MKFSPLKGRELSPTIPGVFGNELTLLEMLGEILESFEDIKKINNDSKEKYSSFNKEYKKLLNSIESNNNIVELYKKQCEEFKRDTITTKYFNNNLYKKVDEAIKERVKKLNFYIKDGCLYADIPDYLNFDFYILDGILYMKEG